MPARLEVITGPMFAGKSEELMRRIHIEQLAGRKILAIKPHVDVRTTDYIASRAIGPDGKSYETQKFPAQIIDRPSKLSMALMAAVDTIIIDEVHFFPAEFAGLVLEALRRRHKEDLLIICAGIDTDFRVQSLGPISALASFADEVTRLTGICMKCKSRGARLTQRLRGTDAQIQVGDIGDYEVRCILCHYDPNLSADSTASR